MRLASLAAAQLYLIPIQNRSIIGSEYIAKWPSCSLICQKAITSTGKPLARTIKVYRIENGERRLAAGAIRASSPDHLEAQWQLFLATAAQGLYVAAYRGVQLGTALVCENGAPVRIAA
jgi:hypothetical protein